MNPVTRRRWQNFFKQKRSYVGIFGLLVVVMVGTFAPLISNNRPIILRYEGKTYFPALFQVLPETLGVTDTFVINYREWIPAQATAGKSISALFAPNPWDPFEQSPEVLAPPSTNHVLGTDSLGRDILARLIYGSRVSFLFGIAFWLLSTGIGVTVGVVQGYFAGKVDFLTERTKELIEVLPFLSVVILVNGLLRLDSMIVTLGVVVFFSWITISSQMRAQVLTVRKREYCEAARASGANTFRILFSHVMPNALTPVLTLAPFTLSSGIATLAVLDYLGYGLAPPTPSLGELLQQGRAYIQNAPMLLIGPTVVLSTLLISINLIGESLRAAFDPRK